MSCYLQSSKIPLKITRMSKHVERKHVQCEFAWKTSVYSRLIRCRKQILIVEMYHFLMSYNKNLFGNATIYQDCRDSSKRVVPRTDFPVYCKVPLQVTQQFFLKKQFFFQPTDAILCVGRPSALRLSAQRSVPFKPLGIILSGGNKPLIRFFDFPKI